MKGAAIVAGNNVELIGVVPLAVPLVVHSWLMKRSGFC